MKKNSVVVMLLLILQVAILLGGIWLTVNLRSDCSFVPNHFGTWQCSANADPTIAPLATFIVLPPLLAKFILTRLGRRISWKRIIITHAIVAILAWVALNYLSSLDCGCGEA